MANPHGVVARLEEGRVRAGARASRCPSWSRSSATTARSATKMNALGPLLDTLGATTKGVTFELERAGRLPARTRTARCAAASPTAGPSLQRDVARLRGDPGAVRHHQRAPRHPGLQDAREAHRRPAGRPGRRARGQADHLRRHPGPARAGHHLAGVVGLGDRRPALLAVHHQRRAAQALAHADRPACTSTSTTTG